MDSLTVLAVTPKEVAFYFRLVALFFTLIAAITVFLLFVYRQLRRARRGERESAEYARAVTEAREAERGRIARELHDGVAGGLRALGLLLYETAGADKAAAWCETLIKQTRDICQSLYPPDFSRIPFADSLQDLCARFEAQSGVCCVFSAPADFAVDSLNALPEETQFQCFRIIQEALANIEKHAHANQASLMVRPAGRTVLFMVSDDGAGFGASDPGGLAASGGLPGGGLGLRAMRDRAKLAGGSLTVESSPEAGVMVTLKIPAPVHGKNV